MLGAWLFQKLAFPKQSPKTPPARPLGAPYVLGDPRGQGLALRAKGASCATRKEWSKPPAKDRRSLPLPTICPICYFPSASPPQPPTVHPSHPLRQKLRQLPPLLGAGCSLWPSASGVSTSARPGISSRFWCFFGGFC